MQFFRAHAVQFVVLDVHEKKFVCSHHIPKVLQQLFSREMKEEERVNMSVKLKALALLLLDEDESENERAEREYWVRPWLANRPQFGAYHSLILKFKKDGKAFKEFLRMDEGH